MCGEFEAGLSETKHYRCSEGTLMKVALLLLLLLLPASAPASDECCFKGPGQCTEINKDSDRDACNNLPATVVLITSCKDAPECHLSEEPPQQKTKTRKP